MSAMSAANKRAANVANATAMAASSVNALKGAAARQTPPICPSHRIPAIDAIVIPAKRSPSRDRKKISASIYYDPGLTPPAFPG
ncbi:MAG: hypothetical protein WAN43_06375 [Rhodomicrobium sp.]